MVPLTDTHRHSPLESETMYESTFTLKSRPFSAAPQTVFYYPADSIEAARSTLTATIRRGNGPAILIGQPGTGKTLLCTLVAEQFRRTDPVALLTCTGVQGRRALLQLILAELGLPYRKLSEGEMRLALTDEANNTDFPHGLLLLVDEAHSLPTKLLEEIRMLSNVVQHGAPRVHVVLAGSSELEERFTAPRLEGFNQRIAARCYIEELDGEETSAYIRWQIEKAGGSPQDVFIHDGLEAVYQATGGVPRLINQLCDHALIMAAAAGLDRIDSRVIQEAWADLQQLPIPTPKGVMATTSESSGIIEFGELVDEADEETSSELEIRTVSTADQSLHQISAQVQQVQELGGETVNDLCTDTPGHEVRSEVPSPFDESFEQEEVVVSYPRGGQVTTPAEEMLDGDHGLAEMETGFDSHIRLLEQMGDGTTSSPNEELSNERLLELVDGPAEGALAAQTDSYETTESEQPLDGEQSTEETGGLSELESDEDIGVEFEPQTDDACALHDQPDVECICSGILTGEEVAEGLKYTAELLPPETVQQQPVPDGTPIEPDETPSEMLETSMSDSVSLVDWETQRVDEVTVAEGIPATEDQGNCTENGHAASTENANTPSHGEQVHSTHGNRTRDSASTETENDATAPSDTASQAHTDKGSNRDTASPKRPTYARLFSRLSRH